MVAIHLLAVIHGMWGNPGHVAELIRLMKEKAQVDTPEGVELRVIAPETNSESTTYDGIDYGGERVAKEILEYTEACAKDGDVVERFSVTGYSLGGLIGRYVVGILKQKGFFDAIEPINFHTIATPHIGLLRYDSWINSLMSTLGPKLLSRTGEQFFCVDQWSATGRPLIGVMADPERIFYQALSAFKHITIYGNAVHDRTVPFLTALILEDDPFFEFETSGIDIQMEEKYPHVIKSYELPASPPAPIPKPRKLSREWFHGVRKSLFVPPPLQVRFPFNVAIIVLLPLLIPVGISLALVNLSFNAHSSRRRIRLLEKDTDESRLIHVLASLEKQVENAMAEAMDAPGSPTPSDLESNNPPPHPSKAILTPVQKTMIASMNRLPQLKKVAAYFPHVKPNTHAIIISRDVKRFDFHKEGEGVIRHWADGFEF